MATRTGLMDGPVSRFQVGDCLGRSFSVWGRNLVPFFLLSLVVYSPLVIYTAVVLSQGPSVEAAESMQRWALVVGVTAPLLALIATGAMTYGVVQQLRGSPVGIGACVAVGMKRLFPVLGVGILVFLCVLGGLFLLVIPGLVVLCMLWVAVPVAVVERPGVLASLRRSRELTNGSKWPIFFVVLILIVLDRVVDTVIQTALLSDPSWDSIRTFLIVEFLVGVVLMGSLQAVTYAVGYFQLRQSKEGASLDDLAKVFD